MFTTSVTLLLATAVMLAVIYLQAMNRQLDALELLEEEAEKLRRSYAYDLTGAQERAATRQMLLQQIARKRATLGNDYHLTDARLKRLMAGRSRGMVYPV